MTKKSIDLDLKFKDFKFSDEVLMKGTFKPTSEFTKVQFQLYIDILKWPMDLGKVRMTDSRDIDVLLKFSNYCKINPIIYFLMRI